MMHQFFIRRKKNDPGYLGSLLLVFGSQALIFGATVLYGLYAPKTICQCLGGHWVNI
jgi:hypothetical protein